MFRSESFYFAWEGASSPLGPYRHLLVLTAKGTEALSKPYEYTIDLASADQAPEVGLGDLLGARASLWIRTKSKPGARLVHGIVAAVEELDVDDGKQRLRVVLRPPYVRASMMKKSLVYVEKTLMQIIDATLSRRVLGMGFELSDAEPGEADELFDGEAPPDSYEPFRMQYAWRCIDHARLRNLDARPYCVQYCEDDLSFVSRLLEEEGISYHFVHTASACTMVLGDWDGAMEWRAEELHLGRTILNHEVEGYRAGARLKPRAVVLDDVDWRKPDLELLAFSPSYLKPEGQAFATIEQPGRYGQSKELGEPLAKAREQRLETERYYATMKTSARGLTAGTVFTLDHDSARHAGRYLVLEQRVEIKQYASFAVGSPEEPSYTATLELVRCGEPGQVSFRPERLTPRPRVQGSQTAVVTAEPGQAQEINTGGEADLGCVRLRFDWDQDLGRHAEEPTSCWVRVSQMFAGGRGHGALFHPRVGDEVIVDFLEGDPDRPIITGRVYNGRNLAPDDATESPTKSYIKSMSSPYDGNYNMIAFDDQQGDEKFIVHVAKDYISNIKHDASRFVANFDRVEVKGDQVTIIHGGQTSLIGKDQFVGVQGSRDTVVLGTDSTTAVSGSKLSAPTIERTGWSMISDKSSMVLVNGEMMVHIKGATVTVEGGASVVVKAPLVSVLSGATVINGEGGVTVNGGTVDIKGGSVNLNC